MSGLVLITQNYTGYGIILNTELNLFQILLEEENFDEALNLLDQACSEGLDLDVLLFNTILQKAYEKVLYLMSSSPFPSLFLLGIKTETFCISSISKT